ncbi:MAG TPA: hypothetical protein VHL30_00595 [Chlamydiales bacterium]|jgi:hypothetical protein|nr:hypothetical protein [Chlamydiales bacterium]
MQREINEERQAPLLRECLRIRISLLSNWMNEIPTTSQIKSKISQAKKAISEKRCFFVLDPTKLMDELGCLKTGDVQEIWPLIYNLLSEIQPKNYSALAVQPAAAEGQLFSFIWKSMKLKKKMQIQFVVNRGIFYYFSLRSYHSKI